LVNISIVVEYKIVALALKQFNRLNYSSILYIQRPDSQTVANVDSPDAFCILMDQTLEIGHILLRSFF